VEIVNKGYRKYKNSMIKHYLNLIFISFNHYLWIKLLLSLMVGLAFLFMAFMCIVILLDSLYRPNIPQYPYNLVLDRIIPSILIICH